MEGLPDPSDVKILLKTEDEQQRVTPHTPLLLECSRACKLLWQPGACCSGMGSPPHSSVCRVAYLTSVSLTNNDSNTKQNDTTQADQTCIHRVVR